MTLDLAHLRRVAEAESEDADMCHGCGRGYGFLTNITPPTFLALLDGLAAADAKNVLLERALQAIQEIVTDMPETQPTSEVFDTIYKVAEDAVVATHTALTREGGE